VAGWKEMFLLEDHPNEVARMDAADGMKNDRETGILLIVTEEEIEKMTVDGIENETGNTMTENLREVGIEVLGMCSKETVVTFKTGPQETTTENGLNDPDLAQGSHQAEQVCTDHR
jgi:hypothetical protein